MNQPHIDEPTFFRLNHHQLSEAELLTTLSHMNQCDFCATRFANYMGKNELIEAPKNLKESILHSSKGINTKMILKTKQTSHQLQLLYYSLKVGASIVGALVVLLLSCNTLPSQFNDTNCSLESSNYISNFTKELNKHSNHLSNKLELFSNKLIHTEDSNYDK